MTRINLSSVCNIKEWPQALPSIKNLDWRVKVAAAVAIASLAVIFLMRNGLKKIEKRPTRDVTVDQLFTRWQLRDTRLKQAAADIGTHVAQASRQPLLDNRIVLRKDAKPIHDHLNAGLPSTTTYEVVQDEKTKQQSCALRVLNALLSNGFIYGWTESRDDFTLLINPSKP